MYVGERAEHEKCSATKAPVSIEAFCLTFPGRELHLPSLLLAKKFQNHGNKDGALAAVRKLESDGLGTLFGDNPVCKHSCTDTCMCYLFFNAHTALQVS